MEQPSGLAGHDFFGMWQSDLGKVGDRLVHRATVAAGLALPEFTRRQGRQRNLPIVRSGTIAAMPDEPIESDSGGAVAAYLAEIHSTAGLSGAPVFVTLGPGRPRWIEAGGSLTQGAPLRMDTNTRVYLVGMAYGSHSEDVPALQVAEGELRSLNLGITQVTPIEDVAGLLDGEAMTAERRADDRHWANH